MLKRNDSLRSTRNCYLQKNNIEYITVHYTGCEAPAKNFCLSQMNNDLEGSAHDYVDSTSWYNAIDHNYCAWHCGGGANYGVTNYNSIGIEMVAEPFKLPPDKTIENTAEIVAYYMKLYNIPISKVVRHYDCNSIRKPCPYGMHGENNSLWNNFKNKVMNYYNGTNTNPSNSNKNNEGVNRNMYIFSANWYLKRYPDVAKNATYKNDPYKHYCDFGKKEGRLPIPPIPESYIEGDFLELNPDIAAAVKKGTFVSGLHHYLMYSFNENRRINKNETEGQAKKRIEELEKEVESLQSKLQEVKKIVE